MYLLNRKFGPGKIYWSKTFVPFMVKIIYDLIECFFANYYLELIKINTFAAKINYEEATVLNFLITWNIRLGTTRKGLIRSVKTH